MTATLTRKPVAHVEKLAMALADARAQRKLWEDKEAQLLEQLLAAHQAGIVPTRFVSAGWSFLLQDGRKTVIYPEPVVAAVKALQAQAVEAGITTTKQGSPFWRITPAKEEG